MIKPVIAINQPEIEIIKLCESLLERAKSGEIRGIGYAVTDNEGAIQTGWEGGKFTRFILGAAITLLAYRYPAALVQEDE